MTTAVARAAVDDGRGARRSRPRAFRGGQRPPPERAAHPPPRARRCPPQRAFRPPGSPDPEHGMRVSRSCDTLPFRHPEADPLLVPGERPGEKSLVVVGHQTGSRPDPGRRAPPFRSRVLAVAGALPLRNRIRALNQMRRDCVLCSTTPQHCVHLRMQGRGRPTGPGVRSRRTGGKHRGVTCDCAPCS